MRIVLLTAGCLIALAGCKDVTYTFPSRATPFKPNAKARDVKGFDQVRRAAIVWQEKFAQSAFRNHPESFAVSPVLAWHTCVLCLSGSDGKTFDAIQGSLGLSGDRDAPTAEVNDWIARHRPQDKMGRGMFFVWPIVPSRQFAYEMATRLDTDVLKIGNAGHGAVTATKDWIDFRLQSEAGLAFDKDNVFESVGALNLGPVDRTQVHPSWADSAFAPVKDRPDGRYQTVTTDITQDLAALNFPLSRLGKFDLRPMSVELDNLEVRGRFRQTILMAPADVAPGTTFCITDVATGEILLVGRG